MPGKDTFIGCTGGWRFFGTPQLFAGIPAGGYEVNNRQWILLPEDDAIHHLFCCCHLPGLVNMCVGDMQEFGNPLFDEAALGVVVAPLLHGVVDAYGMYPHGTGLHLKLRVMNTGFIIKKLPGEPVCACLPGLPEVMGKEGDEQAAHPEIEVPGLGHATHTGIYDGVTGLSLLPGVYQIFSYSIPNVIKAGIEIVELHPAFVFKFLNKMAMPVQATDEKGQVVPVAGIGKCVQALLIDLLHT